MATNETFYHGFTAERMKLSTFYGYEVLGYNRAMIEILNYLHKTTEYKPEKRFIDSVPLIQKVSATLKELTAIYTDSQKEDKDKVNILSGTKTDQK